MLVDRRIRQVPLKTYADVTAAREGGPYSPPPIAQQAYPYQS